MKKWVKSMCRLFEMHQSIFEIQINKEPFFGDTLQKLINSFFFSFSRMSKQMKLKFKFAYMHSTCCIWMERLDVFMSMWKGETKNTDPETLLKVTLLYVCFSRSVNCSNGTKSRNLSQVCFIFWLSLHVLKFVFMFCAKVSNSNQLAEKSPFVIWLMK